MVCTHTHADHVGWNTSLVDGQWVPTFPNARYYINDLESDFWNPSLTDKTGREFNINVYEDSIAPVFDRGLVELWSGDGCRVDDSLRLELKAGHSPGHAVGWIESNGQWGLLSGDSMHSMAQVYRPDWNSVFCFEADGVVTSRRSVLEAAVEHNAILLPAHCSAPHAFRVEETGTGFALVDVV